MISPLINYGLGHIHGAWSPWRYMFLFAGAITVIWAFIILFFLPPDPIRAKGFSDRERYIGVARLRINNAGVRNTHFKKQQAAELLIDYKFWIVFAMIFLLMIGNGPVSTFIPLIVASFGFNTLDSLLLSMPSAFYGAVLVLIATYLASKGRGKRTYIVAACMSGTVIGAALLWKLPKSSKGALLFATCLLPSFASAHSVLLGIQVANTAGYTKRSLASSGIFIGFCFGTFSPSTSSHMKFSISRITKNGMPPFSSRGNAHTIFSRKFCWSVTLHGEPGPKLYDWIYLCRLNWRSGNSPRVRLPLHLHLGKSTARQGRYCGGF